MPLSRPERTACAATQRRGHNAPQRRCCCCRQAALFAVAGKSVPKEEGPGPWGHGLRQRLRRPGRLRSQSQRGPAIKERARIRRGTRRSACAGTGPDLHLSTSAELLLRLRWLAILSGHRRLDLALSGGAHGPLEVVKAVMAGAKAVQMVSALLRHGPGHIALVRDEVERWLEEHEYSSLRQMQGSMNLARCPDPAAFERGNYLRILQSWTQD